MFNNECRKILNHTLIQLLFCRSNYFCAYKAISVRAENAAIYNEIFQALLILNFLRLQGASKPIRFGYFPGDKKTAFTDHLHHRYNKRPGVDRDLWRLFYAAQRISFQVPWRLFSGNGFGKFAYANLVFRKKNCCIRNPFRGVFV